MRAGKLTFTARDKVSRCGPTADAGASPRMTLMAKSVIHVEAVRQ
jgi:hypothetical protein